MILSKVRKTIETKELLRDGDRVLACVSGGPDSMALLHILAELRNQYEIEIFVAHLNHMLRGRAADADADFVKTAADNLGLTSVIEKNDIKKFAKSHKLSLEEAAREARYDFYRRAAEKVNAAKIATGHTLDDQAETVLMRLLKGSGSLGLSGIPYKRRFGDLWIVRPLLDVTRKEIEKYLKNNRIPSRRDASNLQTLYFRNKIRNVLIPILEKDFNPNIKETLSSTASVLSDESSYLADIASKKLKRMSRITKFGTELRSKDFRREHAALQRLIVRRIIAGLKGDLKSITYRHWQGIDFILDGTEQKSVNLPGGIKVIKSGQRIVFTTRRDHRDGAGRLKKKAILRVPGEAILPESGVKIKAEIVKSRPDFKKKKDKNIEYVNGDLVKGHLTIRTRRNGDRIKPLGMGSYKKLHDVFVDEKIPCERRDMVPVIVSGNRVVWVAGLKLSDEFKIDEGTKRILKLSAAKS